MQHTNNHAANQNNRHTRTRHPSLASTATKSNIASPCETRLSFALPTSLAFFKRLTWEQRLWTSPVLPQAADRKIASQTSPILAEIQGIYVTPESIERAIGFGVSYNATANAAKKRYPHLFTVFPHLRHEITDDFEFIGFWHYQIVKPAFNGTPRDERTRDSPFGADKYTHCDADPAPYFVKRLQQYLIASVHITWPKYADPWESGREGKWPDKRANIFHKAWVSMECTIRRHPALKQMQDPVLAVWGQEAEANDERRLVEDMSGLWDAYVDSRFIMDYSFEVCCERVAVNSENRKPETVVACKLC